MLRAGRLGVRTLAEAVFSAPVQTGTEANQASCTTGTGSSMAVKLPGRGIKYTPLPSAEVKERVEVYFTLTLGLHGLLYDVVLVRYEVMYAE